MKSFLSRWRKFVGNDLLRLSIRNRIEIAALAIVGIAFITMSLMGIVAPSGVIFVLLSLYAISGIVHTNELHLRTLHSSRVIEHLLTYRLRVAPEHITPESFDVSAHLTRPDGTEDIDGIQFVWLEYGPLPWHVIGYDAANDSIESALHPRPFNDVPGATTMNQGA